MHRLMGWTLSLALAWFIGEPGMRNILQASFLLCNRISWVLVLVLLFSVFPAVEKLGKASCDVHN